MRRNRRIIIPAHDRKVKLQKYPEVHEYVDKMKRKLSSQELMELFHLPRPTARAILSSYGKLRPVAKAQELQGGEAVLDISINYYDTARRAAARERIKQQRQQI